MKLAYRLAYFSGGFILGLLLLFFILSGKKTSCAYGPEARTLKNIRLKERAYSQDVLTFMDDNKIDTASVESLLLEGDVIFSESETQLDSCKRYVIEGRASEKNIKIKVQNCDKVATIIKMEPTDGQ